MTKQELREQLAAIEHERWADWQKWMHKVLRTSGELTEGADEILQRWDKQIATPYEQLSDTEKASDMQQVDRYWQLIEAYTADIEREARIDELQSMQSLGFHPSTMAYLKERIAELQKGNR